MLLHKAIRVGTQNWLATHVGGLILIPILSLNLSSRSENFARLATHVGGLILIPILSLNLSSRSGASCHHHDNQAPPTTLENEYSRSRYPCRWADTDSDSEFEFVITVRKLSPKMYFKITAPKNDYATDPDAIVQPGGALLRALPC